jgi:hypothetical protein
MKGLIIDPHNVAGLFVFSDEDKAKGRLPLSRPKGKYAESLWDDVQLAVKDEVYISKLNRFSKEYVDWFLGCARAFSGKRRICLTDCSLYESKKDYPVVICYGSFAMLLAPRVEDFGGEK